MNAVGQGTAVNLVHARACFERAQNLGFANASVALKKVEKKLKKTKTQHVSCITCFVLKLQTDTHWL